MNLKKLLTKPIKMTRINIIPPDELMDQHLVAEYREITMVPAALNRTLKSKTGFNLNRVSKDYTLNAGHVYFFYNKGKYLDKRYKELVNEMKARGMNPDPSRKFPKEGYPKELFNDWTPTVVEQDIARERINKRISEKPNWYRKTL
jgi:deoxyribonuclease (pyrimidine dimer)